MSDYQSSSHDNEKTDQLDELIIELLTDHSVKDGNIIGYFSDYQGITQLTSVLRSKGYSFSIRDSDDRTKKSTVAGKREEERKNSVFYHLKGLMPINFLGLPFRVEKTTIYQCAYGSKYYKTRAEKNGSECQDHLVKRKRHVASKKMGCLARMVVKKVVFYLDYVLDDIKNWRKKKTLISDLRNNLNEKASSVRQTVRYYLCISMKNRHNHPPMNPIFDTPFMFGQKKPKEKVDAVAVNMTTEIYDVVYSPSPDIAHVDCEQMDQDEHFFSALVKFPSDAETCVNEEKISSEGKLDKEEYKEDVVTTYQIAIQYPSTHDLQVLFKEKLKRLYSLCEECNNPSLLVKLVADLENVDIALVNDTTYSTDL